MQLCAISAKAEIASPVSDDNLSIKIKIQINGSWVEAMVDENSLRQELGLLLRDLFNGGHFHGRAHDKPQGLA